MGLGLGPVVGPVEGVGQVSSLRLELGIQCEWVG